MRTALPEIDRRLAAQAKYEAERDAETEPENEQAGAAA